LHKNKAKIVLLSVEVVGLVAAEEAINAALKSIKKAVNGRHLFHNIIALLLN
jgi:hypothetical protein